MPATLTARRMETATGPATLTDEHGMQLRMSPGGATSWIRRLNIRGLRTHNAAGHYPRTGLAVARAVAFDQWRIAGAGGDPRRDDGKANAHCGARQGVGRGLREPDGEPGRTGLPGL